MATVATLAVNVIAQTGGFNRGLDKAQKKAKGFGASIGASLKRIVTPAAIAAAAIAGVAIAISKIREQMTRLDIIAKKSRALGIKGQDLIELQHAAELSGVAADTFTSALQKMQKNIGDAVGGIGLARDSLALVGLEIGKLARLDATEQFLVIADKIGEIENASERAAVATAIFGRAGADLIPMFIGGSAAIREQMRDLRELQGVIEDFELTTVEEANDAVERLGKSWEGIWSQAAVDAAPVLKDLVELLTDLLQAAKKLTGEFDGWRKYFLPVFGILLLGKDIFDWATDADAKRQKAQDLLDDAEEDKETAKALATELKLSIEAAIKAEEALASRGLKLLESLRTPMEMYTDTINDLNMMLAEGVIGWITYGRAVEKAQEDIKKSDEFAAKEIRVAERQAVGVAIRGQAGTFSIQQKQHRVLEKIREEERLQLKQLQQQTVLLQQLNNNVQIGVVVGI